MRLRDYSNSNPNPLQNTAMAIYPSDCSTHMHKDGLTDPCFHVARGKLLYSPH